MNWVLESTYRQLPKKFYSDHKFQPLSSPRLIVFNEPLADSLGFGSYEEKSDLKILAGNIPPESSTPIAQAYCGHQFGHFNNLGDGRAVLLGEKIANNGERFDIQLKGSGQTPYSRRGDGRAALGPMLREYIISEAMHALGVPTTRSLAVVSFEDMIYRERLQIGAVLTRVASSHIRVGTFEFAAAHQDVNLLKALADYTIARHFPEVSSHSEKYLEFLKEVCTRQARLIAKWMSFGFIHGVMNTDNMAISGETIDYGPCAFMDSFDANKVFSSIDRQGRYRYSNQPNIGLWNLERFTETLLPLLNPDQDVAVKIVQEALATFYTNEFKSEWSKVMGSKLGFDEGDLDDNQLTEEWLSLLQKYNLDFTLAHRNLSRGDFLKSIDLNAEDLKHWHSKWLSRVTTGGRKLEDIASSMNLVNPAVIPRNYQVEYALSMAEQMEFEPFHSLLNAVKNPFIETAENKVFSMPPSDDQSGYRTFCGT